MLEPELLDEHARKNRECADLVAAQLRQMETPMSLKPEDANGTALHNGAVELRANLKALRIRPAREPGDKPVLEVVLRSEVNEATIAIAAKAGKDLTCFLVPDPELQPGLFGDTEADTDEPVTVPSNGRRRRGTRSSEHAEV
jgi:hypothetical protein